MERIKERVEIARKALSTLRELTSKSDLTLVERDAAIQRFEYTFEALWKAAQLYLAKVAGLFDEATSKLALQMCDSRNMTVHTYNEKIAMTIYHQIEDYVGVFEIWLSAIEKNLKS